MQKLIQGIHNFQSTVFAQKRPLFEGLKDGQSPLALFITCSDSRINPNLITQTEPGELFILRNAGNIIPPYGAGSSGEAGTIEYAVSILKVRDIIICGHSHCGAMAGILAPPSPKTPAVNAWLAHAEATRRIVTENYADVTNHDARVTLAVEENVLVQLENMRTHPSVAAALARHEIGLHAWVYKFETGEVFAYDPQQEQYVSLEKHEPRGRNGRLVGATI